MEESSNFLNKKRKRENFKCQDCLKSFENNSDYSLTKKCKDCKIILNNNM